MSRVESSMIDNQIPTQVEGLEQGDNRLPTLSQIKPIFFYSFYFSQGHPFLQRHIFEYLHNVHPDWSLEGMQDELYDSVHEPIINVIFPAGRPSPNHVKPENTDKLDKEIRDRVDMLDEALASKVFDFDGEVVADIARGVVKKDLEFYFLENHPRVRSAKTSQVADPRKDPFLSHLCYYILEGNTTRVDDFDLLFREVKQRIKIYRSGESPISRSIDKIIQEYLKHHPEKEDFYRQEGYLG